MLILYLIVMLSVVMLSIIHSSCHINTVMLRVVKHNVVCNVELHILLLCLVSLSLGRVHYAVYHYTDCRLC
jgi:hypothetical protein